ncbi:hypothetical protein BKP56_09200 [Marinilactibacillus sp. 15R]|uniref:hypothetical protein n=1 Tax=Marinilactibacillus sp. 15R TaxID=1911586 RepID=UPI00090C8A51|nr:hypothetical protein [Marinilactibacillus sp. 15R]API89420.1 hypothetical protein BKP56_09200 [Marinilactibacillus sp. 15R]
MRDIFALNSIDLKYLEDKFQRYHQFSREIAIRKEELKIREHDTNVGGGRSNRVSSQVENQVIREMSDPFIIQRDTWKKAIEETINEQSGDVQEIIKEKYWGKNSYMDWETLGQALDEDKKQSRSTMYRIRYKVLECFAKKIGYI